MGSQKFPALKIPGPNSFTGVFYKTLKELNHYQSSYKKKKRKECSQIGFMRLALL